MLLEIITFLPSLCLRKSSYPARSIATKAIDSFLKHVKVLFGSIQKIKHNLTYISFICSFGPALKKDFISLFIHFWAHFLFEHLPLLILFFFLDGEKILWHDWILERFCHFVALRARWRFCLKNFVVDLHNFVKFLLI